MQLKSGFIMMLVVVLSFILLVGCSGSQQADNKYPEDFNFVFHYGVNHKNKIDTFENTYTKDLIIDGLIKVPFELSDEEKKRIYEKMQDIHLFDYPEYSAGVSSEPSPGYIFVIEHNGEQQTVGWSGGFTSKKRDREFQSLVNLIIEIIESHEEYKSLPEAKGGYL